MASSSQDLEPSQTENVTDESPKLQSFENWVDAKLRQREEYPVLRQNILFFGLMATIGFHVTTIRAICEKHGGLLKQDSEEFKEHQQIWWYHYRKIMLLRSMAIRYYDLPNPDWKAEIIPERQYMGVLLSEEDFKRFLTKEGSGMKFVEAENPDDYIDKKDPLKDHFKEEQKQDEPDDEAELA